MSSGSKIICRPPADLILHSIIPAETCYAVQHLSDTIVISQRFFHECNLPIWDRKSTTDSAFTNKDAKFRSDMAGWNLLFAMSSLIQPDQACVNRVFRHRLQCALSAARSMAHEPEARPLWKFAARVLNDYIKTLKLG